MSNLANGHHPDIIGDGIQNSTVPDPNSPIVRDAREPTASCGAWIRGEIANRSNHTSAHVGLQASKVLLGRSLNEHAIHGGKAFVL